jgi:hypothetical protein
MENKKTTSLHKNKILNEEQINNLILDLEEEVNLVIKKIKDGK